MSVASVFQVQSVPFRSVPDYTKKRSMDWQGRRHNASCPTSLGSSLRTMTCYMLQNTPLTLPILILPKKKTRFGLQFLFWTLSGWKNVIQAIFPGFGV